MATHSDHRPALINLFWLLTQTAVQLGDGDAKAHAGQVVTWPGEMLLSSRPLSLTGVREKKLSGKGLRLPYRYTGLQLLIERQGYYYVVPLDWKAKTDPIYVIHESDDLWVGLGPGFQ